MTWAAIAALAAGAYGWKAIGMFGLSRVQLRGALLHVVQLLPAALLAALVALNTLDGGGASTVVTRAAGVAAGAVAVWRRRSLVAVIVVAAGVTAALRAIT